MPIYVYKNLNTGETFELEQRITEKALTHHPETGEPIKRLIQPVGIAFKGSGFYVNDSRSSSSQNKSTNKAESKSESSESKTEAKSESKTESKSESKTESKSEAKKESKPSESKSSGASA